jgi:hypothetical protein
MRRRRRSFSGLADQPAQVHYEIACRLVAFGGILLQRLLYNQA